MLQIAERFHGYDDLNPWQWLLLESDVKYFNKNDYNISPSERKIVLHEVPHEWIFQIQTIITN